MTSSSQVISGTAGGAGSPTAAAISALLGLRSRRCPYRITMGVSSGATPSWASSFSAPGSASRSSHRHGIRLRAAKSRSRRASAEYLDPTFLRRPASLDHRNRPGQDREEVAVPVTFGEQYVPRLHRAPLAQP